MFIVDSSVALCWIFEDETNASAEALLEILGRKPAIAPDLWLLEVSNVLAMAERKGRITPAQAQGMQEALAMLPIRTVALSKQDCFDRISSLARSHMLTVYDATYLDLAMRMALPLATLDAALRRAAKRLGIKLLPEQN